MTFDDAAMLAEIENTARDLIESHGLVGWSFGYNNHARTNGMCYYHKKRIELAVELVLYGKIEDITDTILHEIAHALVGPGHKHGPVWQAKAIEIGAKPNACNPDKRKETGSGAKWVAECSCEGGAHFLYRKPKRMNGWRCKATKQNLEWKRKEA